MDEAMRILMYVILFGSLSLFIIVYGFNFKAQIIPDSAKLAQPEFAKVRTKFELLLHMIIIILGFGLAYYSLLPLGKDVYLLLKGGKMKLVSGTITYHTTPAFNMFFFRQSVMLNGDKDVVNKSYDLYLSAYYLNEGEKVSLKVLPNSHMIVSAKRIQIGE